MAEPVDPVLLAQLEELLSESRAQSERLRRALVAVVALIDAAVPPASRIGHN